MLIMAWGQEKVPGRPFLTGNWILEPSIKSCPLCYTAHQLNLQYNLTADRQPGAFLVVLLYILAVCSIRYKVEYKKGAIFLISSK